MIMWVSKMGTASVTRMKSLSEAYSISIDVFTRLVFLFKDLSNICKWRRKEHFKVSHIWNRGLEEKANRTMAEIPNFALLCRKSDSQIWYLVQLKFSLIRILLVSTLIKPRELKLCLNADPGINQNKHKRVVPMGVTAVCRLQPVFLRELFLFPCDMFQKKSHPQEFPNSYEALTLFWQMWILHLQHIHHKRLHGTVISQLLRRTGL